MISATTADDPRSDKERPLRKIAISLPSMGQEEWEAIKEPLFSGWVTQGPQVRAFEQAFSAQHGVKHSLAVTSCTTGLHLILEALGIGPGDEVIVPSFTWVATANAALYVGATPVLVDINPTTFNIDPEAVRRAITPKTKAIIAVHLFGLCAEMEALRMVAGKIPIVEDAACAAGSEMLGQPAGGLGIAAAFSFHPRKSVTTGEGGMVTTQSDDLAQKMTMLRNHGAAISEEERHRGPQPYILPEFPVMGFNFRMTDIQGALGLVQLKKLNRFIDERARWAAFYREELSDLEWLTTPKVPAGWRHGWQSFVCRVDESKSPLKRNELMEKLHHRGIATRPGTHSIHLLEFYKNKFGYSADQFPHSRDAYRYSMALPLHNRMTDEDYHYVVQELKLLSRK